MKKIERPRLRLIASTVRTLQTSELEVIAGGQNPPSNRTDCNQTCA